MSEAIGARHQQRFIIKKQPGLRSGFFKPGPERDEDEAAFFSQPKILNNVHRPAEKGRGREKI